MKTKTVELGAQFFSARAVPATLNPETRTVEVVWTTGAGVLRQGAWSDDPFWELLSLDPAHVRMDRLNRGAPVLNTHERNKLDDVIGVVERAWLTPTEGRAIVRFSKRPDVESIFQDVKDGILTNISFGYHVFALRDVTSANDTTKHLLAVDWEPFEITFCPVGADGKAGVRQQDAELNLCTITIEDDGTDRPSDNQETSMATKNQQAQGNEEGSSAPQATAEANTRAQASPTPIDGKKVREEGVKEERQRAMDIRTASRKAGLDDAFAEQLVEGGVSTDMARSQILDELERTKGEIGVTRSQVRIVAGDLDEMQTRKEGAQEYLLHRYNARAYPLTEKGQHFGSMSLLEMGKEFLRNAGVSLKGMPKHEIAIRALTTSDLPHILANVANSRLQAAYEDYPKTWNPLVRFGSASDFKEMTRNQFGAFGVLRKIGEHGEIRTGQVGESKEKFSIGTYAQELAITRQAIINDSLDAFTRLPEEAARSGALTESTVVYGLFIDNSPMGDGIPLFHASHGNLASPGSPISPESVAELKGALRRQKNLSGRPLNLSLRFLIVNSFLELAASRFIAPTNPTKDSDVNPMKNVELIVEPLLDELGEDVWFGAANPKMTDIIEVAYLEGTKGAYLEVGRDPKVDGVVFTVKLDFGAKVLDWRALYKNPG